MALTSEWTAVVSGGDTGQTAQWCPQPGGQRGRIPQGKQCPTWGQISGSLVEEEVWLEAPAPGGAEGTWEKKLW